MSLFKPEAIESFAAAWQRVLGIGVFLHGTGIFRLVCVCVCVCMLITKIYEC